MKKITPFLILILLLTLIFVGCGEKGVQVKCSVTDTLSLYESQLQDCDFTKFFSITEDGNPVEVLKEYLDLSELPTKGSGKVTVNYKGKSATMTVIILEPDVKVVANENEITLDTKQILSFDFTSLFTVTVDGEPVDIDEKSLDKTNLPALPGEGSVSLTYQGETATVKVILVQSEKVISVTTSEESVKIVDENFASTKFTDYFSITEDDRYVTVMKAYLTVSDIVDEKATVVCSYKGKTATLNVEIQKTVYEINLIDEEIEVNKDVALSYDYLSLFTATRNGIPIELTDEHVTTNLSDELGEYTYAVTVGKLDSNKVTKTLKVNVVFAHSVLIVRSYSRLELPVNELRYFDFTTLFSIYVDGVAYEVTEDMLDVSEVADAEVGKNCVIRLSFTIDDATNSDSFAIIVTKASETSITAKNVNVELYSTPLDLTELFTVKKGEQTVKVTADMISGEVNYDVAGVYEIICSYDGKQGTATVTVSDGVIIDYRYGNKITIMKGTDQNAYSFSNDFIVSINGVTFKNLDACIDSSAVDFSKVGEYTAILTIKYNTKATGISSVKFDEFTANITYVVIDKVYSLTITEDTVTLPEGTTSYDVLSNIKLTINGKKQTLTTDRNAVSVIACYAEIVQGDIDFFSPARQEVSIALYVYGVDNDPIYATYYVCVKSDIVIETSNRVLYVGDTVYTTDLFEIYENGNPVEVTYDMISGKVDTFKSGIFVVSIEYKGFVSETTVVVYPQSIKGEYFTGLTTIPSDSTYDEEDQIIQEGTTAKPIGDLVITEDSVVWDGIKASSVEFVDEKTMKVAFGSNKYTLTLNDGIAFLDPDNSSKLQFGNSKRPLLYFNKDVWVLKSKLQINSLSEYILKTTNTGYSFDLFTVERKDGQTEETYALFVRLVNKTSSDTIYEVKYGEVVFAEDFEHVEGAVSSLEFDGAKYSFRMTTDTVGKTFTEESNEINGKTFKGTYEGGSAVLDVSSSGGYTLYVNGIQKFSFVAYDIKSEMKYGGYDAATRTVTLFSYREIGDKKPCFSAKFSIDIENGTFELLEKTSIWGYYVYSDKMIFLDGYGNGIINYATKSFYTYKIAYTVSAGILNIEYLDVDVTFPYGKSATFALESYDNVLRIKDFYNDSLVGFCFENQYISSGAIIRVGSLSIGKASSAAEARTQLENQITIITKDGILSDSEKSACFNFKTVKFTVAGFYRFGIKLTVNGEEVETYYTVQILDAIYDGNPLVGEYKTPLLTSGYSLTLDKWGRAFLTTASATYESSYRIVDDYYYARFSGIGYSFNIKGQLLANGLISFFSSGSFISNDYLTTGLVSVSATEGACLRKVKIGESVYYYYSGSTAMLGSSVTVEAISGSETDANSILRLTFEDNSIVVVKVLDWNDSTNGLRIADKFIGTFTNSDSVLILDGFGLLTLDGAKGEYQINANGTITATVNGNVFFYSIDLKNSTYATSSMVIDNELLVNKTLSAKYTFGTKVYSAVTTIEFLSDGKVRISSVSDECVEDLGGYSPAFVTTNSLGTYSVVKNKLTITVNELTFVFKIKDVSIGDSIETISTPLEDNSVGYFRIGQVFDTVAK